MVTFTLGIALGILLTVGTSLIVASDIDKNDDQF
jgi:hypothetical protein